MLSGRLHSPDIPESGAPPEKFEKLLARLEEIVSEMESAELPLDQLLSTYEEGMRLVAACGERLADAEQKVEILSRSAAPVLENREALPPSDTITVEEPPEDIRLF